MTLLMILASFSKEESSDFLSILSSFSVADLARLAKSKRGLDSSARIKMAAWKTDADSL